MLILDVGCGSNPHGIINIDSDLYTKEITQDNYLVKTKANLILDIEKSPLPYNSNSFDLVICYHVIEHIKNPLFLLSELIRVSNSIIKIKTPHRYSFTAKMPCHLHYFNLKWFETALSKHRVTVESKLNFETPFPKQLFKLRAYLPFLRFIPSEIVLTIYKY